jgi:hypothetical protein
VVIAAGERVGEWKETFFFEEVVLELLDLRALTRVGGRGIDPFLARVLVGLWPRRRGEAAVPEPMRMSDEAVLRAESGPVLGSGVRVRGEIWMESGECWDRLVLIMDDFLRTRERLV